MNQRGDNYIYPLEMATLEGRQIQMVFTQCDKGHERYACPCSKSAQDASSATGNHHGREGMTRLWVHLRALGENATALRFSLSHLLLQPQMESKEQEDSAENQTICDRMNVSTRDFVYWT